TGAKVFFTPDPKATKSAQRPPKKTSSPFSSTILPPYFQKLTFSRIDYFNQLKRQVDIERSQAEQARLDYQLGVFNALREVEDLKAELRTLDDQLAIVNRRVEAALHAQFLSQRRYDQGVTSYLEYLESQRQAFDAELEQQQVKAQRLKAYVNLYKALGGGWLDESEGR
ncbi:hypothetical protein GC167_01620, partial [bacterium]|nr:hypothetical protein [bacterium]